MPPTILNNSVTKAFTTLARIKTFLSLGSDKYDSRLIIAINAATTFIENYCGRKLYRQTHTSEVHDGKGTNTLILKHWPISSFTSLEYNTAIDAGDSWETFDTNDYHWYEDGRVILVSGEFLERPKKYRATYAAGYLIDFDNENTPASHTLPFEVEYACQKLVSAMFNKARGEGLQSQAVGSENVTFMQAVMSDPELKYILDGYKKISVSV